ncbi:PAS domain-containing sensor histidine kinase [Halosolutus gelatinilyticus]|uniref:PAS domain-containing sensor histidine kinase n=1 Tax=Halosolutus gelatinilyticus TaxID=2931975 RepID=UPI001FF50BA7|nr:PAS domain-containing sensor histidine kinase [Halosolutus gelatinilyticus]
MTVIVLYVAATGADASRGAGDLERSASGVSAVPAVSLEAIRDRAPAADCVVFAETPTTADGAHLLDVIDACGETPLVLYADAAYAPTAARATAGIDGYVRRDGDRSTVHLADEIRWIARGPAPADEPTALPSAPSDAGDRSGANDGAASADARLSSLLEAVPDPAVRYAIVDGEAIVRDVNAAFETVFDEDAPALRGTRLADHHALDAVETGDRTSADRGDDGPSRAFVRCGTPEGRRDFLVTVATCEREDRAVGVATFRDVTDRKRRERALSAQRARLEAFERIVNQELRNRLNLAQGYLAAARETGDPDHAAEVEIAHDRLAESIDALLKLSRRRGVIATVEPVALHDLARRAWARLDDDDRDGRLLHVAEDRLLEADKERLTDALEHLFRSAEPADEGPVTLRVGATPNGFFVADDVPGPDADRERLLEPGADRADRCGYGYGIVTRIAEAHGWSVSINERAAGGTRVEFVGVETDDDWLFSDSTRDPALDRIRNVEN